MDAFEEFQEYMFDKEMSVKENEIVEKRSFMTWHESVLKMVLETEDGNWNGLGMILNESIKIPSKINIFWITSLTISFGC